MIAALAAPFAAAGDAVIVDAGGIGYEVILPPIVGKPLGTLDEGMSPRPPNRYIATRDNRRDALRFRPRGREAVLVAVEVSGAGRASQRAARWSCRSTASPSDLRDQNTHLVDSLPGISAAGAEKIVARSGRK